MGDQSAISWTESTWNPWRGCSKVSPGCAHCYMFRDQRRYGHDPSVVVRASHATFYAPLKPSWSEPRMIFTCSWSDWFHEAADQWRAEAWDVIRQTPQHTYQVLTKRPERILEHLPADWGEGWPNVWLGTSIENRRFVHRADQLRVVPAAVRFISAEPLLGPLIFDSDIGMACDRDWPGADEDEFGGVPAHLRGDPYTPAWLDGADLPELDLAGIDWLIVGGESGSKRRPMKLEWVRELHDACQAGDTAFFVKQDSGPRPGARGRIPDDVWVLLFPVLQPA